MNNEKIKAVLICIVAILIFLSVGFLMGWRFESRAREPLEAELSAHKTRVAEYQGRIATLTRQLGETETSLGNAKDIIIGLREQVEVERRTNKQLLDGIGTAQQSFGGIANRANSAIGIVDICLNLFTEEEDGNDDTWQPVGD